MTDPDSHLRRRPAGEIESLGPRSRTHVGSFLTDDGPVSESGRSALLPVAIAGTITRPSSSTPTSARRGRRHRRARRPRGHGGRPGDAGERGHHPRGGRAQQGETIGILVALVVVVFVFGAVVAGLIPIVLGIVSIAIAMGSLPPGVGLRPALHHRSGRHDDRPRGRHRLLPVHRLPLPRGARRGLDVLDAIARAGVDREQGRAVQRHHRRPRAARHAAAAEHDLPQHRRSARSSSCSPPSIASLTLLPALLALLGDEIEAVRIRGRQARPAAPTGRAPGDRVARTVMRRPVVSVVLAGGAAAAGRASPTSASTRATRV